jgi:hypothetical protein
MADTNRGRVIWGGLFAGAFHPLGFFVIWNYIVVISEWFAPGCAPSSRVRGLPWTRPPSKVWCRAAYSLKK